MHNVFFHCFFLSLFHFSMLLSNRLLLQSRSLAGPSRNGLVGGRWLRTTTYLWLLKLLSSPSFSLFLSVFLSHSLAFPIAYSVSVCRVASNLVSAQFSPFAYGGGMD